jgi:alpha-D-ribose 1-methylphosphonate 5-triphosphate diphosphatase
MMEIVIEGGEVLIDDQFVDASLTIADGCIAQISARAAPAAPRIDAGGLLVLPGIVDIHGDAFERQMMPRPGVGIEIDIALADSDRQAIANGMTTVFHAVTWSWEPGLRGSDNARRIVETLAAIGPTLAADTRLHLRHETYNLDAEQAIHQWLKSGQIGLLAFNDHMQAAIDDLEKPKRRARMVERTGLSDSDFSRLVETVASRADEVPASIKRLAETARATGIRMLSHDDESPSQRIGFRELGIEVSEFPVNEETAREAIGGGDLTVFGAPNVVRGGSHIGWSSAAAMIEQGLCSILASDYYYPAPLLAPFRLAEDRILPLPQAWALVAEAPAIAAGLADRGSLAIDNRADIILVDASRRLRPRVVAALVAGRIVYLTEPQRIRAAAQATRSAELA